MLGESIAHYKVTSKLGAGGMGEVYRATDTKLGRDVALKVLPEALAADSQRMARFQREAQLLASLNHPHIATIHGLEESGATRALVMELVEGPTLTERIAGNGMPMDEALPLARQIAEALEFAHERGIIHRDLKPANIKLTHDGKVKILDFGLAKALAEDATPQDISASPTLSMGATRAGIILGTAAYMSPEQAKGRNVDRRADIWAFGCVLYEMLTGKRAFGGEDVSETLAAIIRGEPEWNALPAATPPRIRALLQRCLQKDARRRLQAIGDARVEIEEYQAHPEEATPAAAGALPAVPQKKSWSAAIPWAVVGLLSLALVYANWQLKQSQKSRGTMRLAIPIEPAKSLGSFGSTIAASPVSDLIAFSGGDPSALYVRSLADNEARLIAGTSGAHSPFFSPDGQWIAFFTPSGQLKKVAVAGGSPAVVTESADGRGGTWAGETIVFSPQMNGGLSRVSASGGNAESVSQPDRSKGERSHRWPRFLPGGNAVLFTIEKGATFDDSAIGLLNLQTREVRTILEGGYDARYSPTGHLLYCRSGQLFAVPFDLDNLTVRGNAVPLPSRWVDFGGFGTGNYELTRDGMLLHLPVTGEARSGTINLLWLDSSGRRVAATQKSEQFAEAGLSPNRRYAAVVIAAADNDIWLLDLERDTLTRLTTQGENGWVVWSPDSQRVAFNSTLGDTNAIAWMRIDGREAENILVGQGAPVFPHDWSRDGRWIAYIEIRPATGADIWLLPIENGKPGMPRVLMNNKFNETLPKISPDGRWIAYDSDESGRDEVYLQSFPDLGKKVQVSTDGGTFPRWVTSSRLYYYASERILSVTLEGKQEVKASRPVEIASKVLMLSSTFTSMPYDVAPDGRILIVNSDSAMLPRYINVELNWLEELRRQTSK